MAFVVQEQMSLEKKLEILSDAAKYDVACTSSGVDKKGKAGGTGNSVASGICHTFTADGRCISLLKILYTNECIFDCKYCINRSSNDVVRTSFTPEEVCKLTLAFYRRNYIEGLFLSSGIKHSPNETMEEIVETLRLLRFEYHFNGYIHCKAIPGAAPELIEMAGWLADRMSVNLELPTAEGLKELAPHKNRKAILNPMRQIQSGIDANRKLLGDTHSRGAYWYTRKQVEESRGRALPGTKKQEGALPEVRRLEEESRLTKRRELILRSALQEGKRFAPAGQSTQMIIGATPESDYQILSVAEALYQKFDLKRVFYSAFIRVNDDSRLPVLPGGPPLLREHRLYQADWLLRYYGFEAGELLSEKNPNFNLFFDPKCNWALSHLEQFPVEVQKADYYTLLRVPGIGVKSASRIVKARKTARLRLEDLKKMGVVLKRARYFITCGGCYGAGIPIEEDAIARELLLSGEKLPADIRESGLGYRQLSLFDDGQFALLPDETGEATKLLKAI